MKKDIKEEMVNYQNGKIYKIVGLETGKQYFGSTAELYLSQRMAKHRCAAKKTTCKSKEIILNEKCDIVLIEKFPCDTKEELHARERYYIENNDCINKHIPFRTQKEYREANKEAIAEQRKKHYDENKKEIAEKNKQYYENNKEEIAEKNKDYREKNKEEIANKRKTEEYKAKKKVWAANNYEKHKKEIAEKNKDYREKNKEEIAERGKVKVVCECGSEVRKNDLARHKRTKKHKEWEQCQTCQ